MIFIKKRCKYHKTIEKLKKNNLMMFLKLSQTPHIQEAENSY